MKKQLFFILAVLLPSVAWSQDKCEPFQFRPFENRNWLEPIIANPRATQIQVFPLAISKPVEYSIIKKPHKIWDVNVGLNFPLLTVEQSNSDHINPGCWGIISAFMIDFHVIENLTDQSNPVDNTDYGFGLPFGIVYVVNDKNQLRFLTGIYHRSTHLGDEFVLNALQAYPRTFKRVDINNQYLESGINLDHKISYGILTQRFSFLNTVDGHGWYTTAVRGVGNIYPSIRNYEPSYGIQLVPHDDMGWKPYVSYNLELSTILNYSKKNANQKESSQFSNSLVVGLRDTNHPMPFTPDIIFRAYYGVNPYGQFRKQNDYWQFGLGLNIPY